MLLIILGAIDVLGAVCAAAQALGYPLYFIQAAAALGLIIKGIIFYDDVVSWIDILIGIMLFIMFWVSMPTMALAIALYLGFKAILSFA